MTDVIELALSDASRPDSDTSYLTHNFHPYAAKFIPQIPRAMIQHLTRQGELVFDPFCGSGTALVEAKLLARRAIGVDINPMAAFMSTVKTTKVADGMLAGIPRILKVARERIARVYSKSTNGNLLSFGRTDAAAEDFDYEIPTFPNRDHWFEPGMITELGIIRATILDKAPSPEIRNLLQLGFAAIIVQCSNQDSETRYAAVKKNLPPYSAINLLDKKCEDMIQRMKAFNLVASHCDVEVICRDSRDIPEVETESVDLVVTSPPYPNTYDYYLYHKQRMLWLGLDWETAKFREIGSRLRHSSQKEDISVYLSDMTQCFKECDRVLKPGARLAIAIGDSVIGGKRFGGDLLVAQLAKENGFSIEGWTNYDLARSSKTFNKAFRQPGKLEHLIVLAKVGGGSR